METIYGLIKDFFLVYVQKIVHSDSFLNRLECYLFHCDCHYELECIHGKTKTTQMIKGIRNKNLKGSYKIILLYLHSNVDVR